MSLILQFVSKSRVISKEAIPLEQLLCPSVLGRDDPMELTGVEHPASRGASRAVLILDISLRNYPAVRVDFLRFSAALE